MIIHIWMHWFWITTASVKGFLFFTVQMISLSCFSHTLIAGAGLLDNKTFTDHNFNLYEETNSSQIERNPNITSLPVGYVDVRNTSQETTSHQSLPPSLYEEISTEVPENESTSKSENFSKILTDSTSDIEDTYNGGSLDVLQYPLKKFTKYSHIKYGKVKMKGKPNEESAGEEGKGESVKIVEEQLNINFSLAEDSTSRVDPDIDKVNDSFSEGNTTEVPIEMTTLVFDNATLDVGNKTESPNQITSTTEEVVLKDEPQKEEAVIPVSSTFPTTSFKVLTNPTEDQKDVFLKNDTLVIENKVEESVAYTTVEPFLSKNRVAAATSAHNYEVTQAGLNAGSITGITLGILVVFSLFGAVSFVLYRRRYLNKPQVLHDKCSNLDSSGYIDDTSLRENSEEMYSLDNDSFLNSLEAMTIQNYWTENVKHTKL